MAGTASSMFDGLEIPDENRLMGVGDGLKVTQIRLGPARLTHCMRWLGLARRALEIALAYVGERMSGRQAPRRPGERAADAGRGGDAASSIGRLLTMHAASRLDAGGMARKEVSMAKIHVADALHQAVDTAIQLCGGARLLEGHAARVDVPLRPPGAAGRRRVRGAQDGRRARDRRRSRHVLRLEPRRSAVGAAAGMTRRRRRERGGRRARRLRRGAAGRVPARRAAGLERADAPRAHRRRAVEPDLLRRLRHARARPAQAAARRAAALGARGRPRVPRDVRARAAPACRCRRWCCGATTAASSARRST